MALKFAACQNGTRLLHTVTLQGGLFSHVFIPAGHVLLPLVVLSTGLENSWR